MAPPQHPGTRGQVARPGELSLVDGLVQLSFLVQTVLGRIAAGYDLSIIQTRLLGILRDRQLGMLELARILNLEKSSITGLVDRAERRGLVQRAASPDDGRAVRVTLSAHGLELAQTFAAEVAQQLDDLVEGLGDANRKRLAGLASHIVFEAAADQGLDLPKS
jgi:DNA-binding MarR family transcriptional regulator